MSLIFKADTHSYISKEEEEVKINWLSVTSLVSLFKPTFDAVAISKKVSRNKKSKWYGLKPERIREIWKGESERALELGTFYHNQRESDICSLASMEKEGVTLPVYVPIEKDGIKHAPEQKLTDGIYPEHLVYLKSAGICGQADLVEIINSTVHITDYKTNKEIKTEGFTNWEGITEKLAAPVNHLDHCDLNHYALQFSIYMYIILKHNPKLKPGKLFIHHITFEKEAEDEYGYPIYKKLSNGDPVVEAVTPIEVPYLRDEVIDIINYIKNNQHLINTKRK
jgi:hypothetical protein